MSMENETATSFIAAETSSNDRRRSGCADEQPDRGRAAGRIRRRPTPREDGTLLRATQITKRYGGLVAVGSVDFVSPGEHRRHRAERRGQDERSSIIAGLTEPSEGSIELGGVPVVAKARRAWAEPFFGSRCRRWLPWRASWCRWQGPDLDVVFVVAIAFLIVSLLVAIVRPRRYVDLLTRAASFAAAAQRHRSAWRRPNLPEHPPIRGHDSTRERAGRHRASCHAR